MSTPNSALWGSLVPGGESAGVGGIDTQEVIDRILPTLRADDRESLTFWTVADLIAWMDDALKRLARVACVFVERDASLLTAAGVSSYSLPPRHVATLHVALDSVALCPTNQLELEARNEDFLLTAGDPEEWYEDRLGQSSIGLAPVPQDAKSIDLLLSAWPPTLDGGGLESLVAAPAPLKVYLALMTIAGAYGREGDMHMPEVAAHCLETAGLLEQVFAKYWGPGQ